MQAWDHSHHQAVCYGPSLRRTDDRSRNSAAPLRRILLDSWRNTSAFPIPLHNSAVAHTLGCGPTRECDLPVQTAQGTLPATAFIPDHTLLSLAYKNAILVGYTVSLSYRNWDTRVEDTCWLFTTYVWTFSRLNVWMIQLFVLDKKVKKNQFFSVICLIFPLKKHIELWWIEDFYITFLTWDGRLTWDSFWAIHSIKSCSPPSVRHFINVSGHDGNVKLKKPLYGDLWTWHHILTRFWDFVWPLVASSLLY